mmetsp:Transcript_151466/g.279286  ORF Transcript_151466/g.279286 Transcript_151466/m.279286 type:complete len:212 (+) Transcript_151466:102-737(+)
MMRLVLPEPTLPRIARLEPAGTMRSMSFNIGLPLRIHEKLPCTLTLQLRLGIDAGICKVSFLSHSSTYSGTFSSRGVPLGASFNFMYACSRMNEGIANTTCGRPIVAANTQARNVPSTGSIVHMPSICDLLFSNMKPQSATRMLILGKLNMASMIKLVFQNCPLNRPISIVLDSFIFSSLRSSHPQAFITPMLKNSSSKYRSLISAWCEKP